MATRTFIVFASHDGPWHVVVDAHSIDVPAEPGAPVVRVAELAAEVMRRAGYRGEPALLAIPSAWCCAASISTTDVPRRHDRAARLFRLEEKLPLAAEDVVSDFIEAGERSLGVCARLEQLRPVVDALEAQGVAVESISPAALLAAQAANAPPAAGLLLVPEEDVVNVITLRDARPVAWSIARNGDDDVRLHVALAQHAAGVTGVSRSMDDAPAAAVRAGRDLLRGRLRPWVNLRRDALASPDRIRGSRRALNAALASAAVLLVAIAIAMLVRANRYEASARADERQLTELFRAEFPGWPVPANVSAVIDSEHRKLAAQQVGAARQASSASALRTLARVFGALPPGTRLALERMTFDERGFVLDGRVAAPAELDAVTVAIRSANLRVAPPQATRDDGGATWRFTLRGALHDAPPPPPPPAPLAEVTR